MTIEKIAKKIAEEIRDMEGPYDCDDDVEFLANVIVKSAAMIAATVGECLLEIRNELRQRPDAKSVFNPPFGGGS